MHAPDQRQRSKRELQQCAACQLVKPNRPRISLTCNYTLPLPLLPILLKLPETSSFFFFLFFLKRFSFGHAFLLSFLFLLHELTTSSVPPDHPLPCKRSDTIFFIVSVGSNNPTSGTHPAVLFTLPRTHGHPSIPTRNRRKNKQKKSHAQRFFSFLSSNKPPLVSFSLPLPRARGGAAAVPHLSCSPPSSSCPLFSRRCKRSKKEQKKKVPGITKHFA